jgi:GNAT superfamily N-acetyltransferase
MTDLAAVTAMRVALLREEALNPFFANPHPDAEQQAERLTRAELVAPGQAFLVAVRDEVAIGMLRCRAVQRTPLVEDVRQAVVTTVYVIPSQRRTGVLRALLRAADQWCREEKLPEMRLQCALTNDTGRKAWESLGFEPAEVLYLREVPRS